MRIMRDTVNSKTFLTFNPSQDYPIGLSTDREEAQRLEALHALLALRKTQKHLSNSVVNSNF
jgi:hypothetical protein